MKKYTIVFEEITTRVLEVEASSPEEAKRAINEFTMLDLKTGRDSLNERLQQMEYDVKIVDIQRPSFEEFIKVEY